MRNELLKLVDIGLKEDLGDGDWTTLWTVPPDLAGAARIIARAPGVIAGVDAAVATFRRVDDHLELVVVAGDGERVAANQEVLLVRGPVRSILSAERLALNFLQRLSGIATATRSFVDAIAGTSARILDTRKTTPGMRALEKKAVLAGGGLNHRFGLHDMVLVKENHIRAAGGITAAVRAIDPQQ